MSIRTGLPHRVARFGVLCQSCPLRGAAHEVASGAGDQHSPAGSRAAKARCCGHERVITDILARAGAINLARLATLGLHHGATGWAIA